MGEWKEYKLGDILNFRRGHDLPHSEMKGGVIPVAGSNGVIGYHDVATPISPCITIGRSGNVGTPYIYEKCWAHNTVLYVDDFKGNYPLYLYYLLKTLPLASFGGGSAVPTLNRNHIHPLIVRHIPNIEIQKNVVSILKSLDDKIEVNRRINENLEQQAQALFKSWFVDFEPFKDGEFVESELGMIPKGWRVMSLNEVCIKITDGSHYSPKDNPLGTIPMLSVKDMMHNVFDYSSCKKIDEEEFLKMKANDCVPLKNDILVAKDGSYLKEIFICNEEIKQALLSSIAIFRPNSQVIYPELMLQMLRLPRVKKDVGDNYVSGSALPRIVLKDFKKYSCVVAPIEIQNKLIGIMHSINECIHNNEQESRRLASLRDTLLPRLMSGELKVNEIETKIL